MSSTTHRFPPSIGAVTAAFLVAAGLCATGAHASAQTPSTKRHVALLVGVADYGGPNVDLLSPAHDVAGVKRALKQVGDFDTMVRLDPDRDALIAALFSHLLLPVCATVGSDSVDSSALKLPLPRAGLVRSWVRSSLALDVEPLTMGDEGLALRAGFEGTGECPRRSTPMPRAKGKGKAKRMPDRVCPACPPKKRCVAASTASSFRRTFPSRARPTQTPMQRAPRPGSLCR